MCEQIHKTNNNIVILDNYPVTEAQLKLWLTTKKLPTIVFFLDLSSEEAKIRKLLRGRADDTTEHTKNREKLFETQTRRLIDFYQSKNILVNLDAAKTTEQLLEIACRIIKSHADGL